MNPCKSTRKGEMGAARLAFTYFSYRHERLVDAELLDCRIWEPAMYWCFDVSIEGAAAEEVCGGSGTLAEAWDGVLTHLRCQR